MQPTDLAAFSRHAGVGPAARIAAAGPSRRAQWGEAAQSSRRPRAGTPRRAASFGGRLWHSDVSSRGVAACDHPRPDLERSAGAIWRADGRLVGPRLSAMAAAKGPRLPACRCSRFRRRRSWSRSTTATRACTTAPIPILREHGVPATIFLATAYLDSPDPFPFDDWPWAGAADAPCGDVAAAPVRPVRGNACQRAD